MERVEVQTRVRADGDGACIVSDRLGFEPRKPLAIIPGMATLLRSVVEWLFRHRHRRIVRHFDAG